MREAIPILSLEARFDQACGLALLASVVSELGRGEGGRAAAREAEAARDRAMGALKAAMAAGYRSAGYRLRKFARKNRRVLATAGAFVLLLAVAALASTYQAIRATLAETKARQAQALAERQFELAQQSETKARQAQEAAERERQQAVTNLYHARVEEAAALRRARGMGYRAQVFKLLQQARKLDTPDKDIDRLRDEAVACLGDFVGLEPITWEDFPAEIRKIALAPDGEQLAIALENGTIQLRNVSTGGVVAELSEPAVDLGIDPANRWLVSAGANGTIKVWPDYGTAAAPAAQPLEMRAEFAGMSRNGGFVVGRSQKNDGRLPRERRRA